MGMGKEPSWEMKKAIIDLAAKQGLKPIVIQRDLDRMVDSGRLLEGESVPDFRTIGRVLKEFQTMDREIIVSEFKPYVWKLSNNFDFRNQSETKVLKDSMESKVKASRGAGGLYERRDPEFKIHQPEATSQEETSESVKRRNLALSEMFKMGIEGFHGRDSPQ